MYSLGIDVGTSGIRGVIMDKNHHIAAQAAVSLSPVIPCQDQSHQNIIGYSQDPLHWWETLQTLFTELAAQFDLKRLTHLALDGTSGTVLLADSQGKPLTHALMYNDQRAIIEAQIIARIAPDNTAAIGVTSGLAKVLWLVSDWQKQNSRKSFQYILSQADWLLGKLSGRFGLSDQNNALKMGYDAVNHCWPDWLLQLDFPQQCLPEVHSPGHIVATILPAIAKKMGFSRSLKLCAGTTDSTAASIASGATAPGEAITSLGSSLVMKVITEQPVFNRKYGVYSQPFREHWLVGGASNSGGAVLKAFFTIKQMEQMSLEIMAQLKEGKFAYLNLNYYPLISPGERFPIADPQLLPRLVPRPSDDILFFQAMLEGLADIEALSYQRLLELGIPYPKLITSMGGGARNPVWNRIREYKTGVPVKLAAFEQAAAGAAILAQTEWQGN